MKYEKITFVRTDDNLIKCSVLAGKWYSELGATELTALDGLIHGLTGVDDGLVEDLERFKRSL